MLAHDIRVDIFLADAEISGIRTQARSVQNDPGLTILLSGSLEYFMNVIGRNMSTGLLTMI